MAQRNGRVQVFQLDCREMVQVGFQNLALQYQVGEFALSNDRDKTSGLQLFQVMGERSGRDGLAFAHLGAGGALSL